MEHNWIALKFIALQVDIQASHRSEILSVERIGENMWNIIFLASLLLASENFFNILFTKRIWWWIICGTYVEHIQNLLHFIYFTWCSQNKMQR